MRVLTTGANGHLGANVARSLLARGHQVTPLVRQGADLRGLQGLGLEVIYGDVMDQKSLTQAAQGCDAMIHMAAPYQYWAKDPSELLQTAPTATRNALIAAKEAGIQRVIYTSTIWATGISKDPQHPRTADDWNEDARNPYAVSKVHAEKEAWRLADEFNIPLIALCPGGLVGPYDYRVTPSMDYLKGWINGTMPIVKGGLSYIDVRDVADVHAAALEMGQPGRRYLVAGENLLMEEYAQLITKLTGIKPFRLPGGRPALQVVAALAEFGSLFTQSKPIVTRAVADEVGDRYMYADCGDTFSTFGVTRHDTEAMLRDAIRWLLFTKEIKPSIAARLSAQFPPDPAWVA